MDERKGEGEGDAYAALGLPPQGDLSHLSGADIRRAYRARALALHPDKNAGDAEAAARFGALTAAYEQLCDTTRRAALDAARAAAALQQQRRAAMGAHRRNLRDKVDAVERAAPAEATNAAAIVRMQDELRALREDAAAETDVPPVPAGAASAWARVPGYHSFLAASLPFEELERQALGE